MLAELAALLGEFLKLAKYYINTGISVSARSYSQTMERGAFGTEQGSAASMYFWSTIVLKLVDIFKKY